MRMHVFLFLQIVDVVQMRGLAGVNIQLNIPI